MRGGYIYAALGDYENLSLDFVKGFNVYKK